MYFIIPDTQFTAKVAKRDIKSLKIVTKGEQRGIYKSIHFPYIWIRGKVHIAPSFERWEGFYPNRKATSEGFHSYMPSARGMNKKDADFGRRVVECIIPKGSLYFSNNKTKQYFSNQLIIKRIAR